MPWTPLPQIASAVAIHPYKPQTIADLPLELGDELYVIEQGGVDAQWFRGYLVAPVSVLAGLTATKGQAIEARVFSGVFPRSCVEVREVLPDSEEEETTSEGVIEEEDVHTKTNGHARNGSGSLSGSVSSSPKILQVRESKGTTGVKRVKRRPSATKSTLVKSQPRRDPDAPKPPAPVPMLKVMEDTPTSASEPLVDEISSCLREWHSTNLHELMLSRQYHVLEKMQALVQTLNLSRRQFLLGVLTKRELRSLRGKTVWDLVKGNKLFSNEVVVRDPMQDGRVLTGDDSAIEVTKLQSMMSLLDERPQPTLQENTFLNHLLVDVKSFAGSSNESTSLVFFLASRSPGKSAVALSESYIVDVPASGALTSLAKAGQMRTLFTDLASSDIGDGPAAENDLYLVVKVRTTQQITAGMPKSRGNTTSTDSQTPKRNNEKPQTPGGHTLKGRRSIMWSSAQRMAKSGPTARLNPLAEQSDSETRDTESRPGTAASRNTDAGGAPKQGTVSRIVSRTIGIGAVKINSLMKSVEETEQDVNIWAPSLNSNQEKQDRDGFDDVLKSFLSSQTGMYDKSRRAERLQLHLKAFNSSDADALIKVTPTLLSNISQTPKMGFSGAPTKSRSDVYITIDEAYLPRQALLSRPVGGATPMSSSIEARNLQVTLEVRRANGERIEDCIFTSSNSEGTGSWESTAASRGESWSQTIRLVIPTLEVPTCHIVMVVADVPNHPFAICHMPLWDQGAFMRDGHHSLLLYRYDENISSPLPVAQGRGGYLSLNWSSRGKDEVSKDEAVTGPISTLRIQSYLCSTRFSQDKVLLGLLDWTKQSAEDVQDLLKRLVFVPEIEIVKLLNNVFDAIFGILCEHSGNDEYEDLVFSALVTVLGIVHDRRFNLGPLVDQYAETRFNYPFATPCLVRSFTRLLANPADGETSRKLRATFKVVDHILKFITHARGQQKEKEAGIGITTSSPGFTRHLRTIFKSLDGLMRNTAPILVGSQTLAVQHFHTWLPELTGLLTTEEILHIAIDFIDSCAMVKGKLVLYKLVLIINYIKLDLFSQPEQRSALCANTVRWLAPHWGKTNEVTEHWKEQVRLCCSVLATQINNLGPEIPDYIPKVVDSYLAIRGTARPAKNRLSLLFPTSYPFATKPITSECEFDEALVELAAILSSISTLPAGMQLELEEEEMAVLVEDILRVHLSILECEAFPTNWLSVHIYHHKSTMKALEYVSSILHDSFLPVPEEAENFNTELWKAFFTTLLKLVGSNALALETFPEQKRRAVWKIADDVRETGAELMRRTWEAIGWDTSPDEKQSYGLTKMGGYQVQYVPGLVAPIVELCLSVHEGLRKVAVEILQTMIISEWTLSEDLSVIQTEMIDCLDRLFKSEPLTESILQKLFINELHALFEPISHVPDDPLYLALKDLLVTIDEFLDLLVAVHSSDATGEASHMMHRLRLMDFLRDMQKEEIFIRYVHQLAQLQIDSRNSTEAGLALRLHADLYDWDPTRMVPALLDPDFPAQTQFERKEKIYFDMIKCYEEGEAWSSALVAYQELQAQYQDNVYDFSKLARTQRAIATVYETISKAERLVPKFFKVTYRGMGFPSTLRDKEFVYEGSPSERTAAFTDRMQEQHSNAQIVTSGDVDDVEGQFLQVSALSLHRDLHNHVFQRSRVPQVIRDYLLSDNSQMFSVTSKRNTKGPVQEHSAEKIIYQTADPFPTILRRSEIISIDRIVLSPSQTALERIIRKTAEMVTVEKRMLQNEEDMAMLLVEAIKISVNPNSESSIVHYRELLPAPRVLDEDDDDEMEKVEEEVELTQIQNALKMALIDHALMIKRCLAHFAKSDDADIRERVAEENLVEDFENTFAPEILTFTPPSAPRSSTGVSSSSPTNPTWNNNADGITSPAASSTRHHSSRRIPPSNTINTFTSTDTSILDTPSNSQARRNRLSFLKRNTNEAKEAIAAPITNGNTPEKPLRVVQGSSSPSSNVKAARGRDEVDVSTRTRSRSPSANGNTNGTRRGSYFSRSNTNGARQANGEGEEEESAWVTSSDLNSRAGPRMESFDSPQKRPSTAVSAGSGSFGSGNGMGGMGHVSGSVRKRLSLMKLGKKGSKGTLLMGGVREED